jgi:hypothetical protein
MIIAIRKKAQEVSFVLLRIAGYIRHKELAARLESISYELIEALYSDDLNTATLKIEAAIGLASLASNVGDINSSNTAILLRELETLKTGIGHLKASREVHDMPSVEGLFSKLVIAPPAKQARQPLPSQKAARTVIQEKQKVIGVSATAPDNGVSATIRQDNILARIRQAPGSKIQLKELIAAFPNISERTLRYDLVKLCQIGKLKREGSGGPSNFYVVVDAPAAPRQAPAADMGVMNNSPMSL